MRGHARTLSDHCLSMMEVLKLPWPCPESLLLLAPTFRKMVLHPAAPEPGGGMLCCALTQARAQPQPGAWWVPPPHPTLGHASHWLTEHVPTGWARTTAGVLQEQDVPLGGCPNTTLKRTDSEPNAWSFHISLSYGWDKWLSSTSCMRDIWWKGQPKGWCMIAMPKGCVTCIKRKQEHGFVGFRLQETLQSAVQPKMQCYICYLTSALKEKTSM